MPITLPVYGVTVVSPEAVGVILLRGLSGAGKSEFARVFLPGDAIAADDFFVGEDGVYRFDHDLLGDAHGACLESTRQRLEGFGNTCVVVNNTFTQRWEMEAYLQLAERLGVRVTVIDLFDGGCTDEELFERNTHGVPLEGIRAMRARYEHDWRVGNPVPPRER